ncbi:MAG: DNA repair protein RecO [Phycisphaerae bacterium]
MPARTDHAIVLRLVDYSETSQIASLFTAENGLVRLIAKGLRRNTRNRVSVGLDLLEYGEIGFVAARGDAGLGTLTEWMQRDAFPRLRTSLARLYGGLYAVELVNTLTQEYDPHPGLFEALLAMLREMTADPPAVIAVARFQARLAREIGYFPRLDACVICQRPRPPRTETFFSAGAGGVVCRDCEANVVEKRSIPAGLLDPPPRTPAARDATQPPSPSDPTPRAAAVASLRSSGDDVDPRRALEWFRLLNYHLTYIAGRPFETAAPAERWLSQ